MVNRLTAPAEAHELLDRLYSAYDKARNVRKAWLDNGSKFAGLGDVEKANQECLSLSGQLNTAISQPPPQPEKPLKQEIEETKDHKEFSQEVVKVRRREHLRRVAAEVND